MTKLNTHLRIYPMGCIIALWDGLCALGNKHLAVIIKRDDSDGLLMAQLPLSKGLFYGVVTMFA